MTKHIPQEEVLRRIETGNAVKMLVRDESYTFYPNDGTPPVHILSGRLTRWLHENRWSELQLLQFPEETLSSIIARNGVDLARVAKLTNAQAQQPVVVGCWADGTNILIDGAHRRYYWAARGITALTGWAVPEEEWRAFVFDASMGVIHDRV